MITLKIPYKTSTEDLQYIRTLQQGFSSVVRFSYNRALENKTQKEIRVLVKGLKNISNLNSWFIQCAVMEGLAIKERNNKNKVIFGGSKNFIQRLKNKITKEEFKERRLSSINIQGEKSQYGNRSFNLKNILNSEIVFKISRDKHISLEIPKMNFNYRKKLKFISDNISLKDLTICIRLNQKFIYLSYEEPKQKIQTLDNRYLGIDLNPNYIGISIKEDDKILLTKCFDFKLTWLSLFIILFLSQEPR